ncbi:MAG: FliM/FliN family flagellar motor switch protein [Planctomycetaceae bacterium]|nr:FliM/FliN family flagellar motor switch protein [Planctomycetaceae bacterium]
MDALQQLCSGMNDDLALALSAVLRTRTDVTLAGTERLAYGNFVGGLENPTFFNLVKAEPLGDCVMLSIEPAILYPMIDRVLGGGQDDEPALCRPLSDIERPLAARIVRVFFEQLRQAWSGVADFDFAVVQVESNPRLLRALPADEQVTVLRFCVSLGRWRGAIRLCVPCRLVESLGSELPATSAVETASVASASAVEISVTLAETTIAADELASLRVGDVLVTETPADSPALVAVAGKAKYRARPGVYRGRLAVCINESLQRAKSTSRVEKQRAVGDHPHFAPDSPLPSSPVCLHT